jgi:predicted porin
VNNKLLAIAVGAALIAPGVSLAAPTVYGKFNVGMDHQEDEIGLDFGTEDGTWKLRDNNNSSRLGVKGAEETGVRDLKVIYQLEYGVDPDGNESAAFSKRNIFLGLEGGFGQFKFGFYDTIVKEVGGKADQFNDTIGDITNLMVGETRTSNLLTYTSPKLGGAVKLVATVQPGEGRTASDSVLDQEDGIADTFYAAAIAEGELYYAAIAYADNQVSGLKFDGSTVGSDILRAVGQLKWGGFELGALYQLAEGIDQAGGAALGGSFEERSWLLSAAYKLESWKLKAQYGQTDGDASDIKRTQLAVGADYKLSKAMEMQLYYVAYEDQDRVVNDIVDPQTDTFGVGLIYSF